MLLRWYLNKIYVDFSSPDMINIQMDFSAPDFDGCTVVLRERVRRKLSSLAVCLYIKNLSRNRFFLKIKLLQILK